MAQFGRKSAAQVVEEEARAQKDMAARRVMLSDPSTMPAPVGQRVIVGYKLARTFSDSLRRPHRIYRAGDLVTDKAEVEYLAKRGALLDPVFPEEPAAEDVAADDVAA